MHYRSEDIFDFEPTDDEDDQKSPQDAVKPLKKKSKKAHRSQCSSRFVANADSHSVHCLCVLWCLG